MSFTITELKTDITGLLHGTSNNKVQGFDAVIQRAGRKLLMDVDPSETMREATIANGIYDSVYDYAAPTDLKGDGILDVYPQVNRSRNDNFNQLYSEEFDLLKKNNTFRVENISGTKKLRLSKSLTTGARIDAINGISDNGTWAVEGDATNLTKDTLNYVTTSASLNFDLSGAGTTGGIVNSTLTSVDLSEHEDISALFVWVFIPDATLFTSVDLRWGDSATTYWNVTATTPHYGSAVNGWNLFRFDWNGATETGSPDSSDITYSRVNITYDGTADTDWRVDNIVSTLGKIWKIKYYSKYLYTTSAGTWVEKISADTDTINLDTDSYNMLVDLTAFLISQQVSGEDAGFDASFFMTLYNQGLSEYQNKYKSERTRPQNTYYSMPSRRSLR